MLLQFLVCKESSLRAVWTLETVYVSKHVLLQKSLACEEVRTVLTEVNILQKVYMFSTQVFLCLPDIVKSKAATITPIKSLVQGVVQDRVTSNVILKDTLNYKTVFTLVTSKLD